MKVLTITQARVGSSRLPNKVMLNIGKESMLSLHLKRLLRVKRADKTVLATTSEEGVHHLLQVCDNLGVSYYQGDLNDVLDRFYKTAKQYHPKFVVRVTSDCPLIDPLLIDEIIETAIKKDVDYCSNSIIEDFPDGQDVEVFKFSALEKAWKQASLRSEREHVTPYIYNNSDLKGGKLFTSHDVKAPIDYNAVRMTVDEPEDILVINRLVNDLGTDSSWLQYADYMLNNKELIVNQSIQRNEGYLKSIKNDLNEKDRTETI